MTHNRIALALALAISIAASGCKQQPAAPPADDNALAGSVQNRISGDSALNGEPIQVAVQNGVATLNGNVSSAAARTLASNDASAVPGIRTVINNLTVQNAATAPIVSTPVPVAVQPTPAPHKPSAITEKQDRQQHADRQPIPPPQPAPVVRNQPVQAINNTPPPPPPPPQPVLRTITIPGGTTLPIRITQTLDSATTQTGENFSGVLATDIVLENSTVLRQGTPVTGHVDEAKDAGHYKGSSLLSISLTSISHQGHRIAITTEPFTKEGAGRGKNTAEKVGGGAAVGAILGGIFGGGKGAAIGAGAGAGVGAGANTVTRGQQVQIPSETIVRFRLVNPISVTIQVGGPNRDHDDGLQRRQSY